MGIMSLTEIMDRSVEILKKYIKTLVTFNLAYWAISFCFIIMALIIGGILSAITIGLKLNAVIIGILFSILGVGIFAFIMSFKIGLIKISSQDFVGERIYASQAIGVSVKKMFKVLGVAFMETILFLPVIFIFAIIIYLTYDILWKNLLTYGIPQKNDISLIILVIVLALLAIFSVLVYITIFSFSFYVLAIEDVGVFVSLKRSYFLVKGDFFKILGCTILFSLSIYAITISLQGFVGIASSIIYIFFKFMNVDIGFLNYSSVAYGYLQWPITILSGLVISPLGTIMITHLYYNQRFKKEGYDITLRLNKIQKDEEKEQSSNGTQYDYSI